MIDPGDKVIPGRIRVFSHATHQNVTFNTRYRGQKWRCRRCQADHIGPCPDLHAFYASKDARAKEIINHKVLSDSTHRRVEQVGLKSDVLCMSGGGVGHLANTLHDDPDKDQIAVFTSGNDYRHKEYAKEGDYVFTIDKSLEKLKEGIVKTPDKYLFIFAIQDDPPSLPTSSLGRNTYGRSCMSWRLLLKYRRHLFGSLQSIRMQLDILPRRVPERYFETLTSIKTRIYIGMTII